MMWRWVTRGLVLGCLFTFVAAPALLAQDFIATIDSPVEGEVVSGMVLVKGFALDREDVTRIDLYVDDRFQHSANLGLPRIDVIQAFPDYEGIQTRRPGFQTGFSANRFPDGNHTVHVRVTTSDNRSIEVGRRTITIDNSINQSPFGHLDIPGTQSTHDVSGSFPVVGWAADIDGVQSVDILVDNLVYQAAAYGDPRPDVGNNYPDLPSALFSGFVAHLDSTRIPEGVHSLAVRVTDRQGLSRIIGRRTVQVFNSTNNLRPFGFIDEPLRDAVLYGSCSEVPQGPPGPISPAPPTPPTPERIGTPVRGWALDLGTREDTGRVAYVELLIDGSRVLSSDDCAFNASFGTEVNCFGVPRFDVQRYYPTYPDAPGAGFVFSLDVGDLVNNRGFRVGNHTLKMRVGDLEQTFADIPNTSGIPVFFRCATSSDDLPSIGYIDFPNKADFVRGNVTFFGWALDQNSGGVQSVEIYVDGNFMGIAQTGLPRTDVLRAYPTFNRAGFAGWQFTLDTRQFSDSKHRLTVQTVDGLGHRALLGSIDFYVDNPN